MYHMRETENQVNGIQIALAMDSSEGAELTISIIDTAVSLQMVLEPLLVLMVIMLKVVFTH